MRVTVHAPTRVFRLQRCFIAALLAFWAGTALAAGGSGQASFPSPDQAFDALFAAVRSGQSDAIKHVLGPGSGKLVDSGDPIADKADRAKFIAAIEARHKIEREGNDRAELLVGPQEWPFPIPLRAAGGAWRFDARAGAQEILDRRIGRNELSAIKTCLAFVDAERDYASADRNGDSVPEYAHRFVSHRGRQDGLYWAAAPGAPQSPLGPLMAAAQAEGYGGRHAPYHGYYFKILLRQGPHATGGARDYIVKGHMIGGFALVAYPAKWGDSGVMSFVVNQDGTVYERNLGRATARIAPAMSRYDPDADWTVVPAVAAAGTTR